MANPDFSKRVYGSADEDPNRVNHFNSEPKASNFQSTSYENSNYAFPYSNSSTSSQKQSSSQRSGDEILTAYPSSSHAMEGRVFNYDETANREYATALGSSSTATPPLFPYISTSLSGPREQNMGHHVKKEVKSRSKDPLNFEGSDKCSVDLPSKMKVKSAHNVIEQRYRNKINDKFVALQHSVPTLRAILGKSENFRSEDDSRDSESDNSSISSDGSSSLEGLEPATKLNKGTILAKTVEYIKFLENKNKNLELERQQLLARAEMLGLRTDGNSG